MSFLQFVWSKKWFDLNSSAAVVATASVSAATVKMMNSPNLCIMVLWNAIMTMVEVFVTKSNHILAEKTRSKRSRLSLSLALKPTEVGGSCVVWSPYITSVPHQGWIVLVEIYSSCYRKSIWIFYEHITSVPHTFVPCFSGAFWGLMILTKNRTNCDRTAPLAFSFTSLHFAALPSILKYPRI